MQAVLKVVEKTGNTGKEASDTLAGNKTGRLYGSITGALGGTFHLCKGILQLLDVIASVLHGLFQFLASCLLLGISFFSVSDSVFEVFCGEVYSFVLDLFHYKRLFYSCLSVYKFTKTHHPSAPNA